MNKRTTRLLPLLLVLFISACASTNQGISSSKLVNKNDDFPQVNSQPLSTQTKAKVWPLLPTKEEADAVRFGQRKWETELNESIGQWYLDDTTIQRNSDFVSVWRLKNFKNSKFFNNPHYNKSRLEKLIFNCRTIQSLSANLPYFAYSEFDAKGDLSASYVPDINRGDAWSAMNITTLTYTDKFLKYCTTKPSLY